MYLDPLAQAIRQDPTLEGITTRQDTTLEGITMRDSGHKICMYADDVLLFLKEPGSSVPRLMDVLQTFGTYSGYSRCLTYTRPKP